MAEIFTCILCGRRGTQRYVLVTPDPDHPEDGRRARCQDRRACQRRIDTARTEHDTASTTPAVGWSAEGASVAGLASELHELRRQVAELRGLRGQVEDITRVVGELAEQVEAMAARPGNPAAPSWLVLPAEQVEAVAAELIEWLGTVWLRYADAVLPECWVFHPDVVEELVWCQHAWQAAYTGPTATIARAGDWHDRYRPGVAKRIKAAAGTCSLERHTHPQAPATAPLAEHLGPLLAWWAEHRHQPAPAPTQEQFAAVDTRRAGGGRR